MRPELFTRYLGIQLTSPVIVGASPMTRCCETVRELVIAGAGAIVMPSLFEEQIVHRQIERGQEPTEAERNAEALAYDASEDCYNGGPSEYLNTVRDLKRSTSVPIIASLDGCTGGEWLNFAMELESSGADALELNLHTDFGDPSLSADQVEATFLQWVGTVCDMVTIPVSVKLLPFHTNLANLAWRLTEAGAAGLVVFGHEPTWHVHPDRLNPTTQWSLTSPGSVASTIAGLVRVRCGGPAISLAASGGIGSPADVAHVVLAGADIAMVTSEVHREGPDAVSHMVEGMISFLSRHGYDSFDEFRRQRPKPQRSLAGRTGYLEPLTQPASTYVDPSPAPVLRTGDRWGHPNERSRGDLADP